MEIILFLFIMALICKLFGSKPICYIEDDDDHPRRRPKLYMDTPEYLEELRKLHANKK